MSTDDDKPKKPRKRRSSPAIDVSSAAQAAAEAVAKSEDNAEQKPGLEDNAAAKPDEKPVVATPDDKPIVATADDKPVAAKPDDKPGAAKPDDKPVAGHPDKPSATPDDNALTANADDKPSATPDDKALTANADDKPSTTPDDKPLAANADDKPSTTPDDKPLAANAGDTLSATRDDKPVAPSPDDTPIAAQSNDKPIVPTATDASPSLGPSALTAPLAATPLDAPLAASERVEAAKTESATGAPTKDEPATGAPATTEPANVAATLAATGQPAVAVEETTGDDKLLSASDDELIDWNPEDYVGPGAPDFMLADEDVFLPPTAEAPVPIPATPYPLPPILPSPQEAALEAARIVSQMVDIDSESGAVIAAAAAAGAAIEAAHAAQKAAAHANAAFAAQADAAAAGAGGEPNPRASQQTLRAADIHAAALAAGTTHDPVTTVRLSRDRILAALANEDIAVAGGAPATRDSQLRMPIDPSVRVRARTEPGLPDEAFEEFDPVAIAAAAISRLRARARTDLAELRVHYHRHDILVLLLAFVIIVISGRMYARMVTPPNAEFTERGLTFERPRTYLRPEPLPMIAPRIVRDPTGAAITKDPNLYFVELAAPGSTGKLEVLIDKKPTWSNIVTGLELDRRSRWGELYRLDASSVESVAGHDWLRTAFQYAHVPEKNDIPRIDRAVEYATIDRDQIYVITMYGTAAEIEQLEEVVAPTLRVPTQTGLPLVPQTGRLSQRKYPNPVGRAFDSAVMVVVADLVEGRLRARGGGSGVIVGDDGSILTNYHVLHDKEGRLHDTFIIGRFSTPDRAPQLQCAGRPNRSKLLREMDLALIKCDMDLDGRTWAPSTSGMWATLLEARASDIKMGQRLWVLGYPDVGGGGLTLSTGEVEGWTGQDGTQGKDFIKTDASITHGNSGGPVIDDQGKLVGIAAAFRTRLTASGGLIETAQVGLVRPLGSASNLLAYAAAGWTPREGYTDVELSPSAVEAAAEGVRIYTTVIDDASEAAVRDATVMVLKAGVNTATIDMNRLDDQAIAWGKTNALGEVRLKHLVPVPGTYTVMVVAPGYEPLIGENELRLDDKTPQSFDPWGRIGLRSR